ncbi:MAG TPA: mechanosensitive ion channel family protein [Sulfitobacter sp.]|uniref:mechanosensitive ion channel family protein n=1 Tax=Sulfitobacter dubius TaxID=218673 RepID=UPI000C642F2F|nr:mechanosensitive ion channel protein [Sulfitobacter sp.]HBB81725.1 mechanosensitive ion channel family protein [Sulfitobacter sp.]
MDLKRHSRRLIFPLLAAGVGLGLAVFQEDLPGSVAQSQKVTLFLTAVIYLSSAWLASRVLAMILDQAAGNRPYPRLLKDLIAAALFIIALAATAALYMGQGAIGALAGSGIVLALLGFAIRNVVADTLSGIALAMEAPFRIGDWVDIDTLALAKVIEIGWRTTRLQTPDATYMILPNSQIARHRITNFSAPKREFRSQVKITLDHVLPIDKARVIMLAALGNAKLIQQNPAPDVRVQSYEEGGICYTVRYWVPRFELAVDCRDEVFSLVDEALREAGSIAPYRRIQLVNAPIYSEQGETVE